MKLFKILLLIMLTLKIQVFSMDEATDASDEATAASKSHVRKESKLPLWTTIPAGLSEAGVRASKHPLDLNIGDTGKNAVSLVPTDDDLGVGDLSVGAAPLGRSATGLPLTRHRRTSSMDDTLVEGTGDSRGGVGVFRTDHVVSAPLDTARIAPGGAEEDTRLEDLVAAITAEDDDTSKLRTVLPTVKEENGGNSGGADDDSDLDTATDLVSA